MSRALALTALTVALLLCVAAAMPAPPKRQRNGAKGKPERKSRDSKGDEVTCEACKAIAVEVGPKVESLVKKLGRGARPRADAAVPVTFLNCITFVVLPVKDYGPKCPKIRTLVPSRAGATAAPADARFRSDPLW